MYFCNNFIIIIVYKMNFYSTSSPSVNNLYIVLAVISVISILLTLCLFLFSVAFHQSKSFILFLVINMLISNLFHVISFIINWVSDGSLLYSSFFLCYTQSIIMIASSISQEYWVAVIAVILNFTIRHSGAKIEKNRLILSILFIFLFDVLPLILSFILYSKKLLGINKLYCWFVLSGNKFRWIVYGLRWLAILISLIFSLKILCYVLSIKNFDQEGEELKTFGKKTMLYPLIQLFGAILPTIYRMSILFGMESSWLQIATVIVASLQGILYPISYGWNSGLFSFVANGCHSGQEGDIDWDEDTNELNEHSVTLKELSEH